MDTQIADVIKCKYANRYYHVASKFAYGVIDSLSICENQRLIHDLMNYKLASTTCSTTTIPIHEFRREYDTKVI